MPPLPLKPFASHPLVRVRHFGDRPGEWQPTVHIKKSPNLAANLLPLSPPPPPRQIRIFVPMAANRKNQRE